MTKIAGVRWLASSRIEIVQLSAACVSAAVGVTIFAIAAGCVWGSLGRAKSPSTQRAVILTAVAVSGLLLDIGQARTIASLPSLAAGLFLGSGVVRSAWSLHRAASRAACARRGLPGESRLTLIQWTVACQLALVAVSHVEWSGATAAVEVSSWVNAAAAIVGLSLVLTIDVSSRFRALLLAEHGRHHRLLR